MAYYIIVFDNKGCLSRCDRNCYVCCKHCFVIEKSTWKKLEKFYCKEEPDLSVLVKTCNTIVDDTYYFECCEIID